MAKTIRSGDLWSGTGLTGGVSNPIHSNAGRLIALLISHAETTVQTLTIYDSLTASEGDEIAAISVAPEQCPYYVRFPRDAAIPFSTGLVLSGTTFNVSVWSVDYG